MQDPCTGGREGPNEGGGESCAHVPSPSHTCSHTCITLTHSQGQRLAPKCRDLVLVAAPKDARAYFATAESSSVLVQRVAEMQVGV